ncbi:peptidase M23 [Rhodospirillum rubrum]|nr:peptidase M23 [Rhodospirillum rubrum]MBK1678095.1 peptidase M23 [Rhodospirillum rubrum]
MPPIGRPVRFTLVGSAIGAALGATLYFNPPVSATPLFALSPKPAEIGSATSAFSPAFAATKPFTPSLVERVPETTLPALAMTGASHPFRGLSSHDSSYPRRSLDATALDWRGSGDGLTATAGAEFLAELDVMVPPAPGLDEDLAAALAALPAGKAGAGDSSAVDLTITVSRGDTLMELLSEQDVPLAEAHDAIEALRKSFDPREIRPGHELTLSFEPRDEGAPLFRGLSFEPTIGTTITLNRTAENGFTSTKQEAKLVRKVARYDGEISSSLFEAGIKAGIEQTALSEMIRIYSYDVDFQRDLQKGDRFSMFYEQYYTDDGRLVRAGDVLFASMTLSGTVMPLYRFEDTEGFVDYYNSKGEGIRKALLRTPINGARLSSGFGLRRHPVLGFSKMHKGVDFAAPPGTPIYAAGDGVVEKAGPFSSYGNYVRIRHTEDYKTAYAHMKGFATGITAGKRVRQGQVIGYVGTTGRSTGPHLHYEILRQNAQVNPMGVRFPSGKSLRGKELAAFQKERARVDMAFQATPSGTKLASAN